MRMGNLTVLFVLFVMAICQGLAQELPSPENAEEKALKQLQGDWELSEELFFNTFFLADFGLEGLQSSIGTRVRVKKDQLLFGDSLDKQVKIQLGTLGDKKLIGFADKHGGALVGIYELEKDTLKLCVVVRGIPAKCARTRGGIFAQYKRVDK